MEPELAPQYTTAERWRFAALYVAFGLAVYAFTEWWLIPHLRRFAEYPECMTTLGVRHATVLIYGLFVGIPLFSALLVGVLTAPMSIRAIRTRRFPPPDQKTLRRTEISKGRSAIALASVSLIVVASFCGLAIWGVFQAKKLDAHLRSDQLKEQACGPAGRVPIHWR
jgi:hypothetical protein